jgi:predicted alpha/beta-hydrolase family hydrolase
LTAIVLLHHALPRIRVPVVFVHGTADPFESIRELEDSVSAISAPVKLLRIDGAGHDLKRGLFDLGGAADALVAFSMNHGAFAAQWPACSRPCQRFTGTLAGTAA